MTSKAVASAVLSVVSICLQAVGLSCASSGMIAVAKGGQVNRSLASVGGAASLLAIVLAVLALPLAIIAWPKERRSVRVSLLLLAGLAVLWSLVMV
jgi:hypothetical protein